METMQTLRTAVLTALCFAFAALTATAQTPTILVPGASVTVAWDAPTSDATNAPTGYRFETFRETDTGVVVTTVDVPVTETRATLPSTVLPPEGAFLLAVRAFNAAGVSGRSNALPFARAVAPGVPATLRLVVAP